jgi:arylsulfatase A-like enzyme
VACAARGTPSHPPPNIVFILSDDHGWADVGWHSPEIKTPNLDQLAATGAKLEQFYAQPVCSPTRAALLTGRYPMRYGLQVGVIRPWADYGLPLDERTLPQMLKEVGYSTFLTGKWHLGHSQPAYLPTHRGFDHQYGHYNGELDYFTHVRDGGFDWHRDDRVSHEEGYTTFLIANEAVRIIRDQPANRPLFSTWRSTPSTLRIKFPNDTRRPTIRWPNPAGHTRAWSPPRTRPSAKSWRLWRRKACARTP